MKKYTVIISILIVALYFAGCSKSKEYATIEERIEGLSATIDEIDVENLKTKLDEGEMILLIDVREHNEHIYGYIPGAVHICRGVLEFRIGSEEYWDSQFLYPPEKTDEVIVYCKKGKRGMLAADALISLGYKNVKNLKGGWKEWEMTYPLIYEKNLEEAGHGPVVEEGGC